VCTAVEATAGKKIPDVIVRLKLMSFISIPGALSSELVGYHTATSQCSKP
jgi:hypothetical protein